MRLAASIFALAAIGISACAANDPGQPTQRVRAADDEYVTGSNYPKRNRQIGDAPRATNREVIDNATVNAPANPTSLGK